jgi:hypothetical protein
MKPKISGACTKCDLEVFEVVERDEQRLPIKLGLPLDDAVRVTFRLMKGSAMDLTFCRHCAEGLDALDYPHLWNRVMTSWEAQSPGHPGGAKGHIDDGIVSIDRKQLWKEVV